jgi:sporulation protein YabP
VQQVICFEQNEVMLELESGTLRILGEELELMDLSIKTGSIVIKGKVSELAYGKSRVKGSLIKRLFK